MPRIRSKATGAGSPSPGITANKSPTERRKAWPVQNAKTQELLKLETTTFPVLVKQGTKQFLTQLKAKKRVVKLKVNAPGPIKKKKGLLRLD